MSLLITLYIGREDKTELDFFFRFGFKKRTSCYFSKNFVYAIKFVTIATFSEFCDSLIPDFSYFQRASDISIKREFGKKPSTLTTECTQKKMGVPHSCEFVNCAKKNHPFYASKCLVVNNTVIANSTEPLLGFQIRGG